MANHIFPLYAQTASQTEVVSDASNTTVIKVNARHIDLQATGSTGAAITYDAKLEGAVGMVFSVKLSDDDVGDGGTACDVRFLNSEGATALIFDAVNEVAYLMFSDTEGGFINLGVDTDGVFPKSTSAGVVI